jgi:hypothetical protein
MKKSATPRTAVAAGVAKVPQRLHYPLDVMLLCVRWYVAYSLSLRNLEMMVERAIAAVERLLKHRHKLDGPAVHCGMIDRNPAPGHRFLEMKQG